MSHAYQEAVRRIRELQLLIEQDTLLDHVFARPALYNSPLWPILQLQEAVILEESNQKLCRHIENRERLG